VTWEDAVDQSPISTARRVDNLQSMFRYADGSGQILTTCHGCRATHCFEVTVEDQARLDGYMDWEPDKAAPKTGQPVDAVEQALAWRGDYVAWLRFAGDSEHRHLVLCGSGDECAFRVYRESSVEKLDAENQALQQEVERLTALIDEADEEGGSLMWTSDHAKILERELAKAKEQRA
jgi:hypothetical protein